MLRCILRWLAWIYLYSQWMLFSKFWMKDDLDNVLSKCSVPPLCFHTSSSDDLHGYTYTHNCYFSQSFGWWMLWIMCSLNAVCHPCLYCYFPDCSLFTRQPSEHTCAYIVYILLNNTLHWIGNSYKGFTYRYTSTNRVCSWLFTRPVSAVGLLLPKY